MCQTPHDADLADLVVVDCGDPRRTHPTSAAALKRGLCEVMAEQDLLEPEDSSNLRFDTITGISPVHLVGDEMRGKLPGDLNRQWLWQQLAGHGGMGFIGMHQAGEGPQKVAFVSHTTCGAIGESDLEIERQTISDDHHAVARWFLDMWDKERADEPTPTILHLVKVMMGDAGSKDAHVTVVMSLKRFIDETADVPGFRELYGLNMDALEPAAEAVPETTHTN